MKKTSILAASLCLLCFAAPVFAAGKPGKPSKLRKADPNGNLFAKYDKNANGILDQDEKDAITKAFETYNDLKQFDADGNGKLDDKEFEAIKNSTLPDKKKKKKKNQ